MNALMSNGSQIINYFSGWSELLCLLHFIFQLCWVFIAAHQLYPVAVVRRYPLVSGHRLLTVVASLVAECSSREQGLR